MSVRSIQGQNGYRALSGSNVGAKTLRASPVPVNPTWVRNPAWPTVAAAAPNEILGLYACFGDTVAPDYFSCNVGLTTGSYRIQLGDGTDTTSASSTQYNTTINYSALPDVGLPYRICTVRITPTTGAFNSINLATRHPSLASSQMPTNGWLEIKLNAPSVTTSATVLSLATSTSGSNSAMLENIEVSHAAAGGWSSMLNGGINYPLARLARAVLTCTSATGPYLANVFYGCSALIEVQLNFNAAPTNVDNMFQGCSSLVTAPMIDLSAVTSTQNMFYDCCNLTSMPPYRTTSALTSTNQMFYGCRSLPSVPLFNTSNVVTMASMFQNCSSLVNVPLFNTASATGIGSMFSGCSALTTVPLFNTASVTNMNSMFNGCTSLVSVPLFNTASVTSMTGMFTGCTVLTTVPLFNTASVTSMGGMFSGCRSLPSVPLFNTASVTDMNSMFNGCLSLTSVPLFNTASVTNMANMFVTCISLTTVPQFSTSAVTNMQAIFSGCSSLTAIPLLNTSLVTTTVNAFFNCTSLVSLPTFNLASLTTASNMFSGCRALRSLPALNLGAVTSSANLTNIFNNCNLQRMQVTGIRFTHSIANNMLSGSALDEYYTGLPTVTGQTLAVSGNFGNTSDNPAIATSRGWTVTGT